MIQNSMAWTCWMLGYPEQALVWRNQAMARAREIAHPWTLSMVSHYSIWLCQFLRS